MRTKFYHTLRPGDHFTLKDRYGIKMVTLKEKVADGFWKAYITNRKVIETIDVRKIQGIFWNDQEFLARLNKTFICRNEPSEGEKIYG